MVTANARRLSIGLLLLTGLLGPSLVAADGGFLDAYRQGLEAIEDGRWEVAAEKMREALEGRSEASRRLVMKGSFRRYVPHYHLGLALFELGDCAGAVEAWAESERQGVASRREEFARRMARYRERCQSQDRLGDRIAPLERQLDELDAAFARAGKLRRDPEIGAAWDKGSPSLAQRQAGVEEMLRQARYGLARARSEADPDLLPEVEKLIAEARRQLRAFERQAEARRTHARPRRANEQREVSPRRAEPRPDPSTEEGELPPAELDSAVGAQLDGDYPRVLAILEGFSTEEGRAMAHAHLLRSAALFALHGIRGNPELLILARDAARAAVVAEPDLVVPQRFFSPRFHDMFRAAIRADQEE